MARSKQELVENKKKFLNLKNWCEQKGGAYCKPTMFTVSKRKGGKFVLSVGYGNSVDANHFREMGTCLMDVMLDSKTELDKAYNIVKKFLVAE